MKPFFQKPEPDVAKLPPSMCVWVNACGAGALWGYPPAGGVGSGHVFSFFTEETKNMA
jgi:hypothetical protein